MNSIFLIALTKSLIVSTTQGEERVRLSQEYAVADLKLDAATPPKTPPPQQVSSLFYSFIIFQCVYIFQFNICALNICYVKSVCFVVELLIFDVYLWYFFFSVVSI